MYLKIYNLPQGTTEHNIVDFFSHCNVKTGIGQVAIVGGAAYVNCKEDIDNSLNRLNGLSFFGQDVKIFGIQQSEWEDSVKDCIFMKTDTGGIHERHLSQIQNPFNVGSAHLLESYFRGGNLQRNNYIQPISPFIDEKEPGSVYKSKTATSISGTMTEDVDYRDELNMDNLGKTVSLGDRDFRFIDGEENISLDTVNTNLLQGNNASLGDYDFRDGEMPMAVMKSALDRDFRCEEGMDGEGEGKFPVDRDYRGKGEMNMLPVDRDFRREEEVALAMADRDFRFEEDTELGMTPILKWSNNTSKQEESKEQYRSIDQGIGGKRQQKSSSSRKSNEPGFIAMYNIRYPMSTDMLRTFCNNHAIAEKRIILKQSQSFLSAYIQLESIQDAIKAESITSPMIHGQCVSICQITRDQFNHHATRHQMKLNDGTEKKDKCKKLVSVPGYLLVHIVILGKDVAKGLQNVTGTDIRDLFSSYDIDDGDIIMKEVGIYSCAYIKFQDIADAQNACNRFQSTKIRLHEMKIKYINPLEFSEAKQRALGVLPDVEYYASDQLKDQCLAPAEENIKKGDASKHDDVMVDVFTDKYPYTSVFSPAGVDNELHFLGLWNLPVGVTACGLWASYGGAAGRSRGVILTQVPETETHGDYMTMGFVAFQTAHERLKAFSNFKYSINYTVDEMHDFLIGLEPTCKILISTKLRIDQVYIPIKISNAEPLQVEEEGVKALDPKNPPPHLAPWTESTIFLILYGLFIDVTAGEMWDSVGRLEDGCRATMLVYTKNRKPMWGFFAFKDWASVEAKLNDIRFDKYVLITGNSFAEYLHKITKKNIVIVSTESGNDRELNAIELDLLMRVSLERFAITHKLRRAGVILNPPVPKDKRAQIKQHIKPQKKSDSAPNTQSAKQTVKALRKGERISKEVRSNNIRVKLTTDIPHALGSSDDVETQPEEEKPRTDFVKVQAAVNKTNNLTNSIEAFSDYVNTQQVEPTKSTMGEKPNASAPAYASRQQCETSQSRIDPNINTSAPYQQWKPKHKSPFNNPPLKWSAALSYTVHGQQSPNITLQRSSYTNPMSGAKSELKRYSITLRDPALLPKGEGEKKPTFVEPTPPVAVLDASEALQPMQQQKGMAKKIKLNLKR